MSGARLPAGGSGIDRAARINFTFAGKSYQGFAGDTLASALLANGFDIVARSFKYHRPRGIASAGSEEPNGLVSLREGARTEPNAKAPMVPLYEGLVANGQNAWPSLEHDAMAVNGLAGSLFSAGFYYKTFMAGPKGTWTKVFEPIIRRAAGMGKASLEADPDRYETTNAFCDVLVVGAGPAGLMAAREAAASGARVIIADEHEAFGGALLHETAELDGEAAPAFARRVQAELVAMDNVTALPRTTVYGHYDGLFAAVERVADHVATPGDAPRQRHWLIRPRRMILATGAIERPIVFGNNDLPGVMLADAVRAYANRYAVAPGRRVAIFTAHDGAYRTVRDLHAAGVKVVAVIDARQDVPEAARAIARAAGAELYPGHLVTQAFGKKRLTGIEIATDDGPDAPAQNNGATFKIDVDLLGVSGGWVPSIHITSQGGAKPIWDERLATFRPGALPETWEAVGGVDGMLQTADILKAGAGAGAHAVAELGLEARAVEAPGAGADLVADAPRPLWRVKTRTKSFVDMQHDVTAADVELAHREGFHSVEHLKRYTTLGMATDQGKTSNVNGLALMAEARGIPIPQAGTTRFRPPYTPVAIGALAGQEVGAGLKPTRKTPMHDWHDRHGAEWVAAGQWMRPRAYLKPGETVRDAYIREARAVRTGVGMVDVSSLGKIDVTGPDTAEFLNRVYVNAWKKLPVGKARYGIMLREDGFVMDDGTTWRLAEHRFLMTTTTANAAKVLSHMEYLLATAWPDLRVHLTSTTEQWAGMAVAGPKSRETLASVIEGVDFANQAFPFMGIRHGTLGGVPVVVTRLSFSGELAYEVYCGSHHGLGVWEAIMVAGAPHAITPYGTEALGTLRIEKGHISGPELDGRTTVHDLGFAGFASKKKAYVGSVMMHREALTEDGRKRLVGLRSVSGQPIKPGSHLVGPDGRSQGHVTSTTHSPELGIEIALGLLENGPERVGERMNAAYPLKDITVEVEIVDPVFIDADGSRMHA